jgi:hypothetical protein
LDMAKLVFESAQAEVDVLDLSAISVQPAPRVIGQTLRRSC